MREVHTLLLRGGGQLPVSPYLSTGEVSLVGGPFSSRSCRNIAITLIEQSLLSGLSATLTLGLLQDCP